MRTGNLALCCLLLVPSAKAQKVRHERIIDMHLHALPADGIGPPPAAICAPAETFPVWDARGVKRGSQNCQHPLTSPMTDEELMNRTLQILRENNVWAVTSGSFPLLSKWKQAGGDRIFPATWFEMRPGPTPDVRSHPTVNQLRELIQTKQIMAVAEITEQYSGISANDASMEPYYQLAEELDVPVGIHMGPGPPGTAYHPPTSGYRMRLSSLLQLEEVLLRHPKLRLWAMHAGWPLLDDAVATLYAHPQLYVDVGVISFLLPKAEFYGYLRRLVEAGFENRIMFGSDQMVWPDALQAAISTIQQAPFLTLDQKRDILCRNAARFLRLGESSCAE